MVWNDVLSLDKPNEQQIAYTKPVLLQFGKIEGAQVSHGDSNHLIY